MARSRSNGLITGNAGVTAHLIDAIGGGLCLIHGKYFGHSKYGLKSCPRCDLDAYYQPIILQQNVNENCGGCIP